MTHRRLVLAILAGCSFAACAPEPVYVAPPPPPPRALTITAQRRQSQAQQDRDKSDCQRIAAGQATSSETWAQVFAGCMGGRGYMVE
jgi:hypothetical protein